MFGRYILECMLNLHVVNWVVVLSLEVEYVWLCWAKGLSL